MSLTTTPSQPGRSSLRGKESRLTAAPSMRDIVSYELLYWEGLSDRKVAGSTSFKIQVPLLPIPGTFPSPLRLETFQNCIMAGLLDTDLKTQYSQQDCMAADGARVSIRWIL